MKVTHLAQIVEPCSYCGVPCLGTVLAWRDHGDERLTVEVDRSALGDLFESLWEGKETMEGYAAMPLILRDWNEGNGWCALSASTGVAYDPRDLQALVAILRPNHLEHTRRQEILNALDALCDSALAVEASVFLLEE